MDFFQRIQHNRLAAQKGAGFGVDFQIQRPNLYGTPQLYGYGP